MTTGQTKSEADYSITLAGRKDVPFYKEDIHSQISPKIRSLLVNHCNIKPEDVDSHCQAIRDKAWNMRAYPCIGLGVFFQALLPHQHPQFEQIIESLTPESRILDIGCFLGTELRAWCLELEKKGFTEPARQVCGLDIVNFWNLGMEFFQDGSSSFGREAQFVQADFLGDESAMEEKGCKHAFDLVTIKEVLHQFDLPTMTSAAERLLWFLKLKPGSQVVGNQIGFTEPKAQSPSGGAQTWVHNAESFKQMWEEVARRTHTRWEVQAELKTFEECGWAPEIGAWMGPTARMLFFRCELRDIPEPTT